MKKKIKHLFFVLFVIASFFVILPIESNAATSGTCGDNLTWTLDDSGTFTISGTGEITYLSNYSVKTSIKSVVINYGVTSIGKSIFSGCSEMTSVSIPNSVKSIGEYAFSGCSKLTSIIIPSSVTSIGNYAFVCCDKLTKVNISDISAWCNIDFDYDSNPLYNGAKLYLNNKEVKDLVIPNGVTSIGNYAFSGCSNQTSIGLVIIGLTSITIPDSVTSIGEGAFSGCWDLKTVYYTGTEADWNNIGISSGNTYLTEAKRIYLECTKTTVSADGTSFTVTPKNIENDNTVILALYSGNVFLGLQSEVYKGKDIPFTTSEDYTKAKVMVWNGFDKMTPISEVENVK